MSRLHEYGIMQEKSDTRAHVCAVVQRVYVFDTEEARQVIRKGSYPVREATQHGVEGATATGWLVPPGDIPSCVGLVPRSQVWQKLDFASHHSTVHRGKEAMRLVVGLIRNGLFPLPAHPTHDLDIETDIDGKDIRVDITGQTLHIQVKCDRRGVNGRLGITTTMLNWLT